MYYYKKDRSLLCLKEPLEELPDGYEELTQEQYEEERNKRYAKSEIFQAREKINQLKRELAKTDYQAIKYAEGLLTEQEYEPIKTQRQEWRNQINELEKGLR